MKFEVTQSEYFYSRMLEIVGQADRFPSEQIPKLRQVFEEVLKELTADEPQYFPSAFNRLTFVIDRDRLPQRLQTNIHAFRKLANKVVHESINATEEDYTRSLKWLAEFIAYYSTVAIPDELQRRYSGRATDVVPAPVTAPERLLQARGVILSIGEVKHASNSEGVYCTLFCRLEKPANLDAISIMLWDSWAEFGTYAWKYATIHVTNLEKVPDKDILYRTTADSFVILEPDFLIDATDIANCFVGDDPNPNVHLFGKFTSSTTTSAMIAGNIVNAMFDDLMKDPHTELDTAFRRAARQNALPIALINSEDPRRTIQGLYDRAAEQYPVIQKVASSFTGKAVQLEPSFLSEKYGLQGRLDCLIEHNESGRKDIIELKSGSPPDLRRVIAIDGQLIPAGVWANNYAQAVCYNLLLKSAYGDRRGSTSILYSRDAGRPLRDVASTPAAERAVIRLRNRLTALEHELAYGDGSVLDNLSTVRFGPRAKYQELDLAECERVLRELQPYERKYFTSYVAFVSRELMMAKVGDGDTREGNRGFSALWREPLKDKQKGFTALAPLRFIETSKKGSDPSNQKTVCIFERQDGDSLATVFRDGDIVVLYPYARDGNAAPLRGQLLKGNIRKLSKDRIEVQLRSREPHDDFFRRYENWVIEPDFLESSFDGLYRSLYDFCRAQPEKRALLLGLREPRFGPRPDFAPNYVTEKQRQLLRQALSARDYFLLQGPPGTGKTSRMLRAMVHYLYDQPEEVIVLLAFTNRAVEEICKAVQEVCGDFLVLGSGSGEKFRDNRLNTFSESHNIPETVQRIKNARIVVSTVSSFLNNQQLVELKQFTTAIVDEASQLLDPHLVGPLSKIDRFILIGDEKQLPAVVTQNPERTRISDPDLERLGVKDLRTSFFERLLEACKTRGWSQAFGTLTEQGRMHEAIQEFPSRRFYGGKLQPLDEWQRQTDALFVPSPTSRIEQLLASSRLIFIDSPPRERGSKVPEQEAKIVCDLLETIHDVYQRLQKEWDPNRTVGVITPYRAQIAEIRSKLSNHPKLSSIMDDIMVDTVERYQGSERDIIIVSFATNHRHQLANLQSLSADKTVDRKLNVTLTRARERLILIGCSEVLCYSPYYKALIEHVRANGRYVKLKTPEVSRVAPDV